MTWPVVADHTIISLSLSGKVTGKIRKLRMERGWSQEHLTGISGLSVRTIQRVENGHKAGLETLKSLAAVFDMEIADLSPQPLIEIKWGHRPQP